MVDSVAEQWARLSTVGRLRLVADDVQEGAETLARIAKRFQEAADYLESTEDFLAALGEGAAHHARET